jgi:hypothetical protein
MIIGSVTTNGDERNVPYVNDPNESERASESRARQLSEVSARVRRLRVRRVESRDGAAWRPGGGGASSSESSSSVGDVLRP